MKFHVNWRSLVYFRFTKGLSEEIAKNTEKNWFEVKREKLYIVL